MCVLYTMESTVLTLQRCTVSWSDSFLHATVMSEASRFPCFEVKGNLTGKVKHLNQAFFFYCVRGEGAV